jgi:predicted RNA-binding Zn-ribbon protein involved in translation (DUF1610 family)
MKLQTYRTAVLVVFYAVWAMVAVIAMAVLGWLAKNWAFLVATVLFAAVFVVSTVFALLVNLKWVTITCPFCRSKGRLASVGRKYTYFVCPRCGEVHPSGPMSRRYVRIDTGLSKESDDDARPVETTHPKERDGETSEDA